MPTNEEGEFELVLGNKQLLSVFFIVVVLLGVFFTMGYIVGRNMSPAGGPQMAGNVESNPLVVEPAGPGASRPPSPDPVEKPSPLPTPTPPPKPEPTKAEPPKPEPVKAAPPKPEPAKPAPPKPEPAKTAPSKPEPTKTTPPKPVAVKPEPPKPAPPKTTPAPATGGTYLQVAATRKPDADMRVDSISKKGFRVILSPVPDSELVRVLVGPAAGPEELAKLKTDLGAIGLKSFPRKM